MLCCHLFLAVVFRAHRMWHGRYILNLCSLSLSCFSFFPPDSCCIEASEDDDFDSVSSKSTGNSGAISLSEVHMGCTIEQILKAKNHVLEGGLLSLMVFPKANTAPSDVYLKKFGGRKKCGLLSPLG